MLNWFLDMVWDKNPISLFCMWISSFLNTSYWNCPFHIVCFWHLGRPIDYKCINLFLDSIVFCSLCLVLKLGSIFWNQVVWCL
jgi:hypothetical protein